MNKLQDLIQFKIDKNETPKPKYIINNNNYPGIAEFNILGHPTRDLSSAYRQWCCVSCGIAKCTPSHTKPTKPTPPPRPDTHHYTSTVYYVEITYIRTTSLAW